MIVRKVQEFRKETTEHDVYKKFQTLRTQYGQEWAKVRKSQTLEDEHVWYRPKVWWWEPLSFLKPYMKVRARVAYISKDDSGKADYDEEEGEEAFQEIQIQEIHEQPPSKKIKYGEKEISFVNSPTSEPDGKEKYVIYEEPAQSGEQTSEIIVEPYESHEEPAKPTVAGPPKRHDEIGKFVAAQMAMIRDDMLFYKTQLEILTVINKAQMKQLEKNSAQMSFEIDES